MIEFQQDRGKQCISTYVNTKVARRNMSALACVGTVREKRRNADMTKAGLELLGALA
jgi:hypothetical protein